jgi:hypothetical protein
MKVRLAPGITCPIDRFSEGDSLLAVKGLQMSHELTAKPNL